MPTPLLARLTPWLLLPLYVALAFIVESLTEPIAQASTFHAFADSRSLYGIPNFADVASNLAILLPAVLGFYLALRPDAGPRFSHVTERAFALIFFGSLIATAFGSTWYHLAPDNDRLLLDRLPIGLAFTALVAWLLAERTQISRGAIVMLVPWLLIGPASVLWWYAGALQGTGDLRPYLLLYVFAFVLPPLLMRLHSSYSRSGAYWAAYFAFALGMACDRLDHAIFEMLGGFLSGHTLKHLLMGVALACLARMLARRRLGFGESAERFSAEIRD